MPGRPGARRWVVGAAVLAAAVLIVAAVVGVRAGVGGRSGSPASTAPPASTRAGAAEPPVESVNALRFIPGTGTGWAVGKGVVLGTGDGGRTWSRLWRGPHDLRDLDFPTPSNGWALGRGVLLGTGDGGRHWRRLGRPRSGPLRRVHFATSTEGWGIAGGTDLADEGPMLPSGATRLVRSRDGGRTWSELAAPAAPRSLCFSAPGDGWLASGRRVWHSIDGGRSWGAPSFTLPADGPSYLPELRCAGGGTAWVRFSGGGAAAGHVPYALYATADGGASWRGVLAEPGTLAPRLHLPDGPGSYPGPFSLIGRSGAFLLSPTPPGAIVGAVRITARARLERAPDIPASSLLIPLSVSFASPTHGWVAGSDAAGRAVILATTDAGRHWHRQL